VAVIFQDYSLELDVGDFSDDETVAKMDLKERKAVYEKARAMAMRTTREGMRHHLTMQLSAGKLALRLMRRGQERFFVDYE